jgi:hypothetical protein
MRWLVWKRLVSRRFERRNRDVIFRVGDLRSKDA